MKQFTKKEWVEVFKESGISDETMHKWHQVFEKRFPDAHADFLKWLGVLTEEINQIKKAASK